MALVGDPDSADASYEVGELLLQLIPKESLLRGVEIEFFFVNIKLNGGLHGRHPPRAQVIECHACNYERRV